MGTSNRPWDPRTCEKVGQGQCCIRNLKMTDIWEERSDATVMQNRHKEPKFKGAAVFRKQKGIQQDHQVVEGIVKFWRSWPLPKQRKGLQTA